MITDEVTIYNLALNAVGTRSNISLPTENSREAEICRLWFGPVRDRVLSAAPWPCTKMWSRLAMRQQRNDQLAWEPGDPEPGFAFAYAPPNDMLMPRYLAGFTRFTLSAYPGNKLAIMTDTPDAVLCYSFQQNVISLWDVNLQMAIVYGLSAYIAMPLHGKAQRAELAMKEANQMILSAREDAANTDMAPMGTIPDWLSARGYSGAVTELRYYHPMGALFSAGELGV